MLDRSDITPCVTLVFTAHNRRDLLREALLAARLQSVQHDTIVMDDASTDGSGEMVRAEFPEAGYFRSEISRGPCYQRNEGIRQSRTEYVVLLDDDSHLTSPETVRETLAEFDDARVGVVAMPYVNVRLSPRVLTRAPEGATETHVAHAFVACAHAVRRDAFLAVGGYREELFYMGEEGDVSLRLLAAGYYVRLGSAGVVHHQQEPKRLSRRADIYGRRNDILFLWFNAPLRYLLPGLASVTAKGLLLGCRRGWPSLRNMVAGLMQGYWAAARYATHRRPVTVPCFSMFRLLKRTEPVPLSRLEGQAGFPARR